MKILYGINGTGQGHLIKSLNLIKKLKNKGADIDILVSGTNNQIDFPFEIKYKFHGLSFVYGDGGVDYIKTIKGLKLSTFLADVSLKVDHYDKVITDFEPISAWACKVIGRDCIGVSHQYAFLSKESPRPKNKSFVGEFVLRNMAPVTTPIGLHFEKYDDFILSPVIRGDVLKCTPDDHGHYTVYLPSYTLQTILNHLINIDAKFHIFSKEVKKKVVYKNCTILPNSRNGFFDSFISCHGVITSSGFETPSESLYLDKKLMVIPIKSQYEQLCNNAALVKMGIFSGDLKDIQKFIISDKASVKIEDSSNQIISMILK